MKPAIPCIAQEDADRILAMVKAELVRHVRLLPEQLAPQFVGKSAAEVEWIWGEAVNALCVEVEALAGLEIEAATVFKPTDY